MLQVAKDSVMMYLYTNNQLRNGSMPWPSCLACSSPILVCICYSSVPRLFLGLSYYSYMFLYIYICWHKFYLIHRANYHSIILNSPQLLKHYLFIIRRVFFFNLCMYNYIYLYRSPSGYHYSRRDSFHIKNKNNIFIAKLYEIENYCI